MGLLDFMNTDEARMGLGLLAAAGPRSDGAGFGQRMMEGIGYADQYKAGQQKSKFLQMQMDEAQAKMEQEKAAREMMMRKQAALPGLFTGGSAGLAPLAGDAETGMLPSMGRASTPASLDVQKALMAGYTPDEIGKLDGLRNIGRNEVARTMKGMVNGREVDQQYDKFGGAVGKGMEQYKAPIEMSTGASKMLLDPFTRQPLSSFKMEQSPESRASNYTAMRGQNMTDSRARDRLNFDQNGGADSGGTTQVQFNKQFGKAPAGYRWTASGGMEFIPGGPADQKAQMQKSGEGTVGGVVADLRDKYTQLNAENGIVSTKNRIGTNIGAWMGATGLGQGVNGAIGTKTQSARDSIAMTRPLLLQSIMKATGMSAKQMDSNAELKLYLATATDPQKGLEANLEALDRIESLYGGGTEKFKPSTPQASTKNGWSMEKVQ